MFNITTKEIQVGDRTLAIETGKIARQADGAVMVRYGDTVVLVTAVMAKSIRDMGFLPLTVEFKEKTYAAGKIPGGFFKREGRPTENEVLYSRLIDRPIRPLFNNDIRNEIQVIAMVMSMDKVNDPGLLGINGASLALMISDIPWAGPVAAVRVGRFDGEFKVNPTFEELPESEMDITVVVGREGVVMVEGLAQYVPEDVMVDALLFAQEQCQPILDMQDELAKEIGKAKREVQVPETDEKLLKLVEKKGAAALRKALNVKEKKARYEAIDAAREKLFEALGEDYTERVDEVKRCWKKVHKAEARGKLFKKKIRIDGRKTTDVRPIVCEAGLLPRTHGSALFTRGETQAICTVTLGTAQDEQRMDALAGEYHKRYMLHYNFPPFSVGEARMLRGPSRRDVGHGMLAERGTTPILPDHEDFPYTIRIVSEVTESNGSSSMATVCGTTLAMMDAGVPVKDMVAGVAMGLMKEGDKVEVLTDILGDEDHLGDMDFKVVGSESGISAIQMDIKISGLSKEILIKALNQAKDARLHILGEMKKCLDAPRPEMSEYAPRITQLQINPDRIRDLIGPGGKHIKGIIEETGVMIDVTDDGVVRVASFSLESKDAALRMIGELTAEAEIGKIYDGKVVKVVDFGAFIAVFPGCEGLCHISEMAEGRIDRVDDVMKEGDEVKVKVLEVDERTGKMRLSHRAALTELGLELPKGSSGGGGERRDGGRRDGGRRDGGRRDGGRRDGGGGRRGRR